MRLFLEATSERGKSVTKSGNDNLTMELFFERKMIGRVCMAYNERDGYTARFFPITETTCKNGYTILHEEKTLHNHWKERDGQKK